MPKPRGISFSSREDAQEYVDRKEREGYSARIIDYTSQLGKASYIVIIGEKHIEEVGELREEKRAERLEALEGGLGTIEEFGGGVLEHIAGKTHVRRGMLRAIPVPGDKPGYRHLAKIGVTGVPKISQKAIGTAIPRISAEGVGARMPRIATGGRVPRIVTQSGVPRISRTPGTSRIATSPGFPRIAEAGNRLPRGFKYPYFKSKREKEQEQE